nr:MAG TPA: hypothetical protein [Caudoviricetes sp.]
MNRRHKSHLSSTTIGTTEDICRVDVYDVS